jgi:hypothetical protein
VYAPTYAPQTQYAPVTTYAYQGGTYIIESPYATSKKEQMAEAVSEPYQAGAWELPIAVSQQPSRVESATTGTNLTTIAIIAVIGLLGFGAISTLGGKKKK